MPRSIDSIKEDIERLQQSIDDKEAERLALGLNASPLKPFVKASHAVAMLGRTDRLAEVLTDYLRLLNRSKQVLPFPIKSITERQKDTIALVEWSEERTLAIYAGMLRKAIELIERADEEMAYEYLVMRLYERLKYADEFKELALSLRHINELDDYNGTDEQLDEIIDGYIQHYKAEVLPIVLHEKAVLGGNKKRIDNE